MVQAVARWLEDLNRPDMARQAAAAEQLSRMGEEAQPAAVALVRACGGDDSVREWAHAALEALGPPPREARSELAELSRAASEDVAYWAVTLLGRLDGDAADAAPVLVEVLGTHPSLAVRERAAWALGRIQPTGDPVIAALESAARDPHPRLARLAGDALAAIRDTK